jgi:hypothetical protein
MLYITGGVLGQADYAEMYSLVVSILPGIEEWRRISSKG